MLQKVHVGHQGQEKCKIRVWQVNFWPKINQDIDRMIGLCNTCFTYRDRHTDTWAIIARPSYHRAMGKGCLRCLWIWQEAELADSWLLFSLPKQVSSISSAAVINGMKSVFSRHGIPHEVFSDNGPAYDSEEFEKFAKDWDFVHATASPHYPHANGLAERTVRIVRITNKIRCLHY